MKRQPREQNMTLVEAEKAIARIPIWKDAADIKIALLTGGITNRNYRVDVGGESFALRISGDKTELLGINREHEYRTQYVAARLGIAPEAVYFHKREGYLVTRFIVGHSIPPEELRQPENLQVVAGILRRIHSMPEIPGVFNAFQVVREYAQIAQQHNVQFPANFDWLIGQMNAAEAALTFWPLTPAPCHNDLLNGNFLLGDKLYILDWEYAGMGDLFFDLANFSNNHELSAGEDRLLLDCYFGEATPHAVAHLNIMKVMSDFREAMWGLVQVGISDLDFDFREYAEKHFDRLTKNIANPNWEHWLEEIGASDSPF
jgi:thiamine kinase-like enzyme